MEHEHRDEFDRLRSDAIALLLAGRWDVVLWEMPSFADWIAVGVQQTRSDVRIVSRRWANAGDAAKFQSPVERLKHPFDLKPTITEHDKACDASVLKSIRSELQTITIPVSPTSKWVTICDGTRFHLRVNAGNPDTELSWQDHCPEGWLPLATWFGKTWRAMMTQLEQPPRERFPWEKDL